MKELTLKVKERAMLPKRRRSHFDRDSRGVAGKALCLFHFAHLSLILLRLVVAWLHGNGDGQASLDGSRLERMRAKVSIQPPTPPAV